MAALQDVGGNSLAVVRLVLQETASAKAEEINKSKLRICKLDAPVFLSNLYTYKIRQLDADAAVNGLKAV